jgi:lactate racemase
MAFTGRGSESLRLDEATISEICATEIGRWDIRGKRVLAIVPDQTRTAPMDVMFRVLHRIMAPEARAFDVLIALGTHPPMTEAAINSRLGISAAERVGRYADVRIFNHRWNDPEALVSIGAIDEDEVERISGGRMRERVDVTINKLVLEYDLLLVVGPTFPHEVAGFSGGNKYLFPGISGPAIIDMFHWLGALITNPGIIGVRQTPVRQVIDRAAAMVPVQRKCIALVSQGQGLAGLFAGDPEETWEMAARLSAQIHVVYTDRAYDRVLSCAPPMYDELWVAGKCVYKLEPIVADGGELVVYAPHLSRISKTHGDRIREIGYHVRDYFLAQWQRFAHVPRGVLAHSTHVKGIGTYANGVERPRIRVTLATQIGPDECRAVNLGYCDPARVQLGGLTGQDTDGSLVVERAGEILHRLGPRPRDAE